MATFADGQVTRLQTLLQENVGLKTVTVGNTTVTYEDLLAQYDYWQGRRAREQGKRPRASQINLSGF